MINPAIEIENATGGEFALLRLRGFADGFVHAFVVRGEGGGPLFRPGPIPREEILRTAGLMGASLHLARQVHGAGVIEVPDDTSAAVSGTGALTPRAAGSEAAGGEIKPAPLAPEADALVTRRPGHAVGVSTADCLPVLLAMPGGGCAAVHAGWRGLLAGVIEAALRRLAPADAVSREGSGVRNPLQARGLPGERSPVPDDERIGARGIALAPVQAAIGPAIGPCCFEVGEEVACLFRERFPGAPEIVHRSSTSGRDSSYVDLPLAARTLLEASGVLREAVRSTGPCTRCGGGAL